MYNRKENLSKNASNILRSFSLVALISLRQIAESVAALLASFECVAPPGPYYF